MSSEPAIRFAHVSKRYRLGEHVSSLRDLGTRLTRTLRGEGPTDPDQEMWALRDVSFTVAPGEALGIIGPNGAGKTTTLKLLSRITYPTEGEVEVRGRFASLIELGAGFHPDLTGRENVYLNGAILGLSRKQIDARLDEIVAFAELERFIDTPVKRYSSGMYARLGFSVAAHIDPDVLLIDEVLAVGDMRFQQRCFDRMREMRGSARALVFISHNLFAMRSLCTKAILLNRGQVVAAGAPAEVIQAYQDLDASATSGQAEGAAGGRDETPISLQGVEILDAAGSPVTELGFGERMVVRIHWRATRAVEDPTFSFAVLRPDGRVVTAASTQVAVHGTGTVDGEGTAEFVADGLPLMPGVYTVYSYISDDHVVVYDKRERMDTIRITTERPMYWSNAATTLLGTWHVRPARGASRTLVAGGTPTERVVMPEKS